MTIYQELENDHKKVIGLIDQLIAAEKSDPKVREDLVEQIRDELIPHARAEEAVLYNCIRDIDGAKDVVGHAYQEHLEAESVFRGLQVTDAMNITWVNGAKKLKESLQHHIQEEEGKVFSAAKRLFTDDEAKAMGDVFTRMKPMVKQQSFAGHSFDMLVNMMPRRMREAFSNFAKLPMAKAS